MTIANRAIPVLRRLLDGLLLALVLVSLGVLLLGRILPFTGHPTLVVAGPSMEPAIPMGAAVVLDQVPPSSLAVGDVVTLRSGPERAIFTHRIIRLADGDGGVWLETQGDANGAPDPSLTPATAVLGRVAVSIPYVGYVLTFYSVPSGIIAVVSFGLVLLLLGVMLEPRATRRVERAAPSPLAVAPGEPAADSRPTALAEPATMAAPPFVPIHERSSVQEVVASSRQRRARQARSAAATNRRAGRPATGS